MTNIKNKETWQIRAIQLDLARHMEPVDYILEYIDAAAENGFNTLVLYLEGRIRTKTFSYMPVEETYSPREIKKVVEHASKKDIEVIPVIPALGHANQILGCKELTHLSEERNGKGRFGTAAPSVFCISQKETYDFIAQYFAEIAEIFPGKNFHAGLDEAWNFGFCPLCRKKWKQDGLAKMFIAHLKKLVKILKNLDKRMWMWDDMLELFPEALKHVPRSIVMCHWNYEGNIEADGSQAHFANRFRQDWLKEYEKLGIDAVVCPWDRFSDNIEALTKHANSKKVLGGLLTQWEGSPRLFAEQPFIANLTGKLWTGNSPEKAWDLMINDFYRGSDPIIKGSLKIIISLPRHGFFSEPSLYLSGNIQREEQLEHDLLKFAIDCLSQKLNDMPAEKRDELERLLWSAKWDMVFWGLRKIIPEIYDPLRNSARTKELKQKIADLSSTYRQLMDIMKACSKKWHIGINPDDKKFLTYYENASSLLTDIAVPLQKLPGKSDWLVVARLYLQDFYGSPRLKISAVNKNKTIVVTEGCFKPNTTVRGRTGGHYDYYFPLKSKEIPELLIIEGWCYGGQGISFIKLKNKEMTLNPYSIKSKKGPVSNPKAILTDDSSITLLGRTDIKAQIMNPDLADKRGIIACRLKKMES